MTTILVVDDDRHIVRLVRGYLEEAGYIVLQAYDGASAWQTLRSERPSLVILDLGLPDRDGWEIMRQIRGDSVLSPTPVIMLTARVEDSDKIIGLELGADDYITKPFNPREVLARVRALLRRSNLQTQSTPTTLKIDNLILDTGQRSVQVDGQTIDLTPTEFELMHLFMANPGYTFTREELVMKTLGYAYEGTGRVLDSHIKNLRQKIEPGKRRPHYILTVHRVGYRFKRPKRTL